MRHPRSKEPPAQRPQESGFALLFVFALAASAAILLYMELPRAVFEAQRNREALLIERGEEYQRAIQLYFRRFQRYPASIDDLESMNNMRFLRRRYKDPMTGKDDWRLVHMGPAGFLTDSLVRKPGEAEGQEEASVNTFVTEGQAVGSTEVLNQPPTVRQQRPGTSSMPGSPPDGAQATVSPGFVSTVPGTAPPVPGGFPTSPTPQQTTWPFPSPQGMPGQEQVGAQGQGAVPPQGIPGLPGPYGQAGTQTFNQPTVGGQVQPGGFPQGTFPGQMVLPSGIPSSPYAGRQQVPPPQQQGSPVQSQGYGQPGYQQFPPVPPGGTAPSEQVSPQNPALQAIQNLLTTPRPGGLQGLQASTTTGQQIGGGIAGVATTFEGGTIKIYNDRQKFQEWEFIYDFQNDGSRVAAMGAGGASGQGGTGAAGQASSPTTPFGSTPASAQPQGIQQQPGSPGFTPQMGRPTGFGRGR